MLRFAFIYLSVTPTIVSYFCYPIQIYMRFIKLTGFGFHSYQVKLLFCNSLLLSYTFTSETYFDSIINYININFGVAHGRQICILI